ncbi:stage V sporulation protein AB [Metabacillus herbersteinensis]|uniref:Stage V sporulation protein AB n=1 Tax=Metabacillus herbersteinensis TaxID=283816 RepID=A0ABV6GCW6_9BACI
MIIKLLFIMFLGFSSGVVVGGGFVAFLTVLGIIPRLTQLTKTVSAIQGYEWGVILGALIGSWLSLSDTVFSQSKLWTIPIGLLSGVFVGMLAAALTEVMNVFPILAKRIGFGDRIIILLMALVFGKIFGSLFHWVYFVNH